MICPLCGEELVITDQESPTHLKHVFELREEIARLNLEISKLRTREEGAAELAESHDAHVEMVGSVAPGNSRADEFTDQDALN